jgi:hypothetical protein
MSASACRLARSTDSAWRWHIPTGRADALGGGLLRAARHVWLRRRRNIGMRYSYRLGVAAGVVGPVAFTTAWVLGSIRQDGHSLIAVQISGLAAPDARDSWIMVAGFVALGACTVAFGAALRRALAAGPGSGAGPRLTQLCGLATLGAGLLRRDRMTLFPGGVLAHESWHNHAHDAASILIYIGLVGALLALGRRFRGDPYWSALWYPTVGSAWATCGLLMLLSSGFAGHWDGLVQRVAVTLPLGATVLVAWRLGRVGSASRSVP